MAVLKKILSMLFVCIFIIGYFKSYSSASFTDNIYYYDDIDMSDLSVTISDTYTANKCIMQADANENGCFATMTYYFAYAQDSNIDSVYFKKKFVDIFDNAGNFICELIFYTKIDPTLRISGNCVYIFFFDTVLIFNINSRDIKYYLFDPASIDISKQESEFEVGKWKYKLSKSQALGYRQLIRYSDNETQILIDIPMQFDYGLILTFVCVGGVFISKILYSRRHGKRQKENKTWDGWKTLKK